MLRQTLSAKNWKPSCMQIFENQFAKIIQSYSVPYFAYILRITFDFQIITWSLNYLALC